MAARLPNTHFPRSRFSGLPAQSSTSGVQQPLRGVRQDKGVLPFERLASNQPASVKQVPRSRVTETKNPRSQNKPTFKRKTVPLQLWVHPLVKAEIQRLAEREELSVSKVGAAFLEKAIRQDIHSQYGALIEPIIEQAIAKHMRAYSNRLAVLLVRGLFASEQVRGLVTNILSRQDGVTQPDLEEILNGSSSAAKRNITRLTPQLAALVEEIKQWMEEGVTPNE